MRIVLAAAFAASVCGAANATTLVDLVNAPGQASTPFRFTLTATSASTTISFAGYDVTNDEYIENIAFADMFGTDLLSSTWTLTRGSSSGSTAEQNGSGDGLHFYGQDDGAYDTFSQILTTTPGGNYTLTFDFSNYAETQDGLRVTTNAVAGAVPEPVTWAMMLVGFGLAGTAARRSRHGRFPNVAR
jgi:hypothetical protein